MTEYVETYKKNKINSTSSFDFTTANEATAYLLYDRDYATSVSSSGSADGTNEAFKIEFEAPQYIDAIGIMGHNIDTGNIKYLDSLGAENNFSPAISFSSNTDTNSFFDFSNQYCYGLVINCTNTIDTGEKRISQVFALEDLYQFESATRFNPNYAVTANFNQKEDGGNDKIIKGSKSNGTIIFDDLKQVELDNLMKLSEYTEPFFIYLSKLSTNKLKRFFRVQDLYLVNMMNSVEPQLPAALIDDVGWIAEMEFSEV